MSAHNPYEALTPVVTTPEEVVEDVVAAEEEIATPEAVKPEEAPETPAEAAPEGSIAEVLEWVGEDKARAQLALGAELADGNRKTLLKTLKTLV